MEKNWVARLQGELRKSRERPGDSGFVKPGINYGSVAGSSAKFYGQGILNIKKAKSSNAAVPLLVTIGPSDTLLLQTGGLVNNIPVATISGTFANNSFVYISVASSAGIVQSASAATGSPSFVQTASQNYPPTSLNIPIYKMVEIPGVGGAPSIKKLLRLLGANNITIQAQPAQWVWSPPDGCGAVTEISYVWSVFS